MALLFDNAVQDYLQAASAFGYSGLPITISLHFNADEAATFKVLFHLGTTSTNDGFMLITNTSDQVVGQRLAGAISDGPTTANTFSAGTYSHLAVRYFSTSADIILDGTETSDGGPTLNPSGVNQTTIGNVDRLASPLDTGWSGSLADVAMWDVALSDAEIARAAAGESPASIRPHDLMFYREMVARGNGGQWDIGQSQFTASGTTKSRHPFQIYPSVGSVAYPSTATPITRLTFNNQGISDGSTTINTTIGTKFGQVTVA